MESMIGSANRAERRGAAGMATVAVALMAVLIGGPLGCRSVEVEERPLTLAVAAAPGGAAVQVSAGDEEGAVNLGKGPIAISNLVIVRKRYVNDSVVYWLRDDGKRLPENVNKPAYASHRYAVGADYPLELTFSSVSSGADATASLRLDADLLARLWQDAKGTVEVQFRTPRPGAPAGAPRGGGTPR